MCSHYSQTLDTSLKLKDFLPFLSTIITIIMGFWGISIQIRKNRKERWIDDFRKVVSEFISNLEINAPDLHTKMEDIIKSNNILGLYLDPNNLIHQELSSSVKNFLEYVVRFPKSESPSEKLDWEKVRSLLDIVKTHANKIIITETIKNNSLFPK